MESNSKNERDNQEFNKEKSLASSPAISLPKGGGAIRGIGEKFSVNPVTGTSSLSIPIATSPSRADFSPKLSLSYDSGAGNGPFGMGWNLSVPLITRKTEKGLPKYQDAEESDVFLLSGAEDLVPSWKKDNQGNWQKDIIDDSVDNPDYTIQRYRPRMEGLFARIERWTHKHTGDTHWVSISKENITTIYGRNPNCRIFDNQDNSRIFSWLIEESYDTKGNVIVYKYKQENEDKIDKSLPQENHRQANNSYLKYIKYGNKQPNQRDNWLFQIVFDYGEHNPDNPKVSEEQQWNCRPDTFSTYRASFEVRTYRLCQRVLMFHQFDELGNNSYLVRSTDFSYEEGAVSTYLKSATQTGYLKIQGTETYHKKSLPPLEFTYSQPKIDTEIHTINTESLENLPIGLDGSLYQWLDLDSEGISGILTEQADAWFYKRNLGNAKFAPAELVATKPSVANLQTGQQQIMDLAGDGHQYLVQFSKPLSGYYERNNDGNWEPFTPFSFSPNIDWREPNLKFIDLNGDGHADILISEHEVFVWYPSQTKAGFGASEIVRKLNNEDKGPALVFADGTDSIYLADMSGDGLTDIVRIRNGEVCYWPNLGYGRFGAKVTMDNPPWFDYPDQFYQRRIRLADIDGSGTTDIIYLGINEVKFWLNQSGNSWSTAHKLTNFPRTDNLSSVTVVDLLGNGTACIVWSSPLPGDAQQPMSYIDLMSGEKPHLMQSVKNNMGMETRVQYTSSTKFYLEDLAAGNPWITKLPFPVHVVERVETRDGVSDAKFVTLYRYRHGYYDGVEREFRGFGLVEQWDTESFTNLKGSGLFAASLNVVEEALHLPPIYTKTWFHTGAYLLEFRLKVGARYQNSSDVLKSLDGLKVY